MPNRPSQSAKNVEGDFGAFERALKTVLSVPHSKIKAQLEAEKQQKIKHAAVSRASRDRG
jgi:hypothetical protein